MMTLKTAVEIAAEKVAGMTALEEAAHPIGALVPGKESRARTRGLCAGGCTTARALGLIEQYLDSQGMIDGQFLKLQQWSIHVLLNPHLDSSARYQHDPGVRYQHDPGVSSRRVRSALPELAALFEKYDTIRHRQSLERVEPVSPCSAERGRSAHCEGGAKQIKGTTEASLVSQRDGSRPLLPTGRTSKPSQGADRPSWP